MTFTHSFAAVTPPPRFDAIPWTNVVIEQSATRSGTFTVIDTQAIAADATPDVADAINVTTHLATLETGWFRFHFTDSFGSLSPSTAAIQSPGTGSSYVTVEDLRATYPELANVTTYPDDVVQAAIDLATEAFEHAADVAFSPRTETLILTASDTGRLSIPRSRVISVDSVTGSTSGTVAVDGQIVAGSLFLNANAWTTRETLTVVVTHGYVETPAPVVRAVQVLARHYVLRGSLDDRATQIPSADGGVINLATPGFFGATFGIPYVDQVLADYGNHALVV